jgi:hypothetical protein
MARRVKCPGCGAIGHISPYDETFEARGSLPGGKPVARCTRCGCGVMFGLFSGMLAGRPKLIPAQPWEAMKAEWDAFQQELKKRFGP